MTNIFTNYTKKEGLKKTLKNMGITWGIPALIFLLDSAKDIIPNEYLPILLPITGAITYFIKNWVENR